MAQKRMSDFFNTKLKKQAKSFKYCISKEKEEEDEVICLSGSKESGKQVKDLVGQPKRKEFIYLFIYLRFIFN